MSRPREFKQVDVFASAPFLGNPLAAVVDGTDLPAELMQRFARWTNLSETVFLLPPSSPDAGYAVRIFTPFQELPFAGHPTLGAARAWLDSGGTPRARGRIVQECGAGLVPIVCDGADLAFQAPATRRSGPIEEDRLAEIAAALGVNAGRILDHQWVDDGPGWAAVEVSSAEEVLALEPDFSGLPEAMVGVVGVSASSQARLQEQLRALGTNMLTARSGADLSGAELILPEDSVGRTRMIPGVTSAASTSTLSGVSVYRSRLSDPNATGGIITMAADTNLLDVVSGKMKRGAWLNEATAKYPGVVLGSKAAQLLGVVQPGTQVWLGGRSFTVLGILEPAPLAEELDNSALIGVSAASTYFDAGKTPTTIYERSSEDQVENVRTLLGPTLAPQGSTGLKVSRPSDALAAQNAADQTFTTLLAGVGSIALLVGGIGVANTMIISVLERRKEIGLRRSLGAKRSHISVQFLAEALILSFLGGVAGCLIGGGVTWGMCIAYGWPPTLHWWVIAAGLGATVLIGAIAGLYPAIRAARTPPTAALASQ